MSVTGDRLIVVLGYSDRRERGLHPICAARLAHAATVSTERDVVVLSGWARTPGAVPEAELMADAWQGTCHELVIDPDARHTVGNATNAIDDLARTASTADLRLDVSRDRRDGGHLVTDRAGESAAVGP